VTGDLADLAATIISLGVIMNALPILPVILNVTGELPKPERRSLTNRALVAGAAVGLVIAIAGPGLFRALGITVNDLRIGGGVVLMVFAVHDLLFSRQKRKEELPPDPAIVPLGIPLLMGPATMTALAVLVESYATWIVLVAFLVNVAINWLVLNWGPRLFDRLGVGAVRALGKVYGLVLVALASSMLRAGITASS